MAHDRQANTLRQSYSLIADVDMTVVGAHCLMDVAVARPDPKLRRTTMPSNRTISIAALKITCIPSLGGHTDS
jgi:hypothetical protein